MRLHQGYAVLRRQLEAEVMPIGPRDLLIATTALRHGVALISRNVRELGRAHALQVANGHATIGRTNKARAMIRPRFVTCRLRA